MTNIESKKIVIAGGSGFLGVSMATSFADAGAKVTILSRSVPKVNDPTFSQRCNHRV